MPTEKWISYSNFQCRTECDPEKSTKYAVNDQYLIRSISLRKFIAKEFDQLKKERIQGLIFKTRVDPICSTLLEVCT